MVPVLSLENLIEISEQCRRCASFEVIPEELALLAAAGDIRLSVEVGELEFVAGVGREAGRCVGGFVGDV